MRSALIRLAATFLLACAWLATFTPRSGAG
jgi:hypothetical protein